MKDTPRRRWVQRHKRLKLCVQCPKPAEIGRTRCGVHLKSRKNEQRSAIIAGRIGWKSINAKYGNYKRSAKSRGYTFNISFKNFKNLVNQVCTYCGTAPPIDCFNGIDRIDNRFGYTMKNSTPCCGICNQMKFTHSTEIFLNHIIKIYRKTVKP